MSKILILLFCLGFNARGAEMGAGDWSRMLSDLAAKGQVTRYPEVGYVGFWISRGDAPDPARDRHVEYLNLGATSDEGGTIRPVDVTEVIETWKSLAPEVWRVDQAITTVRLSGNVRSILSHTLVLDHHMLTEETNVVSVKDPDAAQVAAWQESVEKWRDQLRALPVRPGGSNAL